mgnify:CR=1 FL=1
MADAFHQAAVAQKHIRTIVDDREAISIEFSGQQFLCERHADTVGDTLSERAGRRFHPRRDIHFRMSRRAAAQAGGKPSDHPLTDQSPSDEAVRTAASNRGRWTK